MLQVKHSTRGKAWYNVFRRDGELAKIPAKGLQEALGPTAGEILARKAQEAERIREELDEINESIAENTRITEDRDQS